MADLTPEQRAERIAEIRSCFATRPGSYHPVARRQIDDLLAEVDRLRAELSARPNLDGEHYCCGQYLALSDRCGQCGKVCGCPGCVAERGGSEAARVLAELTSERDEARAALAAYELKPGEVLVRAKLPAPGYEHDGRVPVELEWWDVYRGEVLEKLVSMPRSAIVAGLPRDAASGKGGDDASR